MNPFLTSGIEKYTILNIMSSKKFIILNSFSKRLKELIKSRLKISQKAFANEIGVEESYLSMVLNENSGPSADMIAGIYLHYSEYLEWLLTGHERKIAPPGIAEAMPQDRCPLCGDMTEETKELCKKVKEIIESKNIAFSTSLKTVITVFEQCKYEEKEKGEPIRN